jgi:methylase of polypeptide subunit release factors
MAIPELPKYDSDEVRVFHPFFDHCLNNALRQLGFESDLEVVHHWTVPPFTGIVDFVVRNRTSKKILLPIELKKTPMDLTALGRKQARGYWNDLGNYRGSDFYMASNLEKVELFRNTPERRLTLSQLVETQFGRVGDLYSSKSEDFAEQLSHALAECLTLVTGNDGTRFASNISGLIHALEYSVQDAESWHQAQSFYAFDYIKGALMQDSLFADVASQWPDAAMAISDPTQLGSKANSIDFNLLFEKPIGGRFNSEEIREIVAGAFEAGRKMDLGQDLNLIVNELVLSRPGISGVVETEMALADTMLKHVKLALSKVGQGEIKLLEPGCGSGNLILAAKRAFPNLSAGNVIGIEQEELFREVLSLRVGLAFTESLWNREIPDLRIDSITSLTKEELQDTNLVLMNPPFIRGIDSVELKRQHADAINQLNGEPAKLAGGQLGLECVYLENIISVLPDGALVAAIFPKNALTRSQSSAVRSFLMDEFGLFEIVDYGNQEVFSGVQKSTVIVLGRKNSPLKEVRVTKYRSSLAGDTPEVETTDFLIEDFADLAEIGWKSILETVQIDAASFISKLQSQQNHLQLRETSVIVRGRAGNSGASDFIFGRLTESSEVRDANPHWNLLQSSWVVCGAKNSDRVARIVDAGADQIALRIPEEVMKGDFFREIANAYCSQVSASSPRGIQRRNAMTPSKLASILIATDVTTGYFVLVPRASRVKAQISISYGTPTVVSTNFIIAKFESSTEATFMSAWLLSVFGQLQLEYFGVDQEGMRKVEVSHVSSVCAPSFASIEDLDEQVLGRLVAETDAINRMSPQIRPLDILMSELVFGRESSDYLKEAFDILQRQLEGRDGGY